MSARPSPERVKPSLSAAFGCRFSIEAISAVSLPSTLSRFARSIFVPSISLFASASANFQRQSSVEYQCDASSG